MKNQYFSFIDYLATRSENQILMTSIAQHNGQSRQVTLLFSLLFLFFIQQLTMFVEAIYQHNLLDKRIGFSVLGFLFFLSPVFLFFINRNIKFLTYIFVFLFLLSQGISPWLPTPLRIVSTGIGVSVFLLLFALFLSDKRWEKVNIAVSIAFATLLSIILRAFGST
ncbi:MAG: hypothetical protein V3U02_12700, partial [Calditrichia bacterium]